MKNLLYKELKLCVPSFVFFYLAFSCMLLIPSYPYLVAFFFICNATMYIFTQGQANGDFQYSAMLPIAKRDIVRARYLSVMLFQMLFVVLCTGLIFLHHGLPSKGLPSNPAGIDGGLTLLGAGLSVIGLYNLIGIPAYFKSDIKIGRIMLTTIIGLFAYIFIVEGIAIASAAAQETVPLFDWIERTLDCFPETPAAWTAQIIALLLGAAAYAALTALGLRKSIRNFEQVNL